MKLAHYMPRIGSGVSYALVLIASLFCFDFEPSSGPERLLPQEVVLTIAQSEAEAPVPEVKRPATLLPIPNLARKSEYTPSLGWLNEQMPGNAIPIHFDARGPPLT